KGDSRMVDAVNMAIASPLLEVSIDGAKGVLFNVTGGEDLGILEVYEAADIVAKQVDPDANIIVGAVIDPAYAPGEVKVTLIATGFELDRTSANVQRTRSYPGQATSAGHAPAQHQPTQPVQRPAPQPQPQPQPRVAPSFNSGDDLDIPPFLRNRNRGR
ncbi:MAG: cell division protein FtsZ, partial [Chloroflexales bacterium]|nr:cell division protein FtsZ [Chloroflexales bacterium]